MSENSNSSTVCTLEKSGVENVGPTAEGTKVEGDSACSTAPNSSEEVHTDLLKNFTKESSQEQHEPGNSHESGNTEETLSPEPHQVKHPETFEGQAQINAAEVNEEPTPASTTVENLSSWTLDHKEQDALTGRSKASVTPNTDAELFSDSFTHISITSGSHTLLASDLQEGLESEETHLTESRTEDFRPDVKLLETKEKEGDGLRKRKITHLCSLDQGRNEAEDDEGEEEGFQVPQREEEKVFSLNKCILAAVILLGIGTIFLSGVLMDTGDEGDVDVKELKDPADKWLNPEVSGDTPLAAELPDILNKQAKDDQQILELQAQLQQHQGELKAAQQLAEEGEKERVRREELEKDYQRMKEELDRLPALQKELEQENERMKEESERAKKELEALPSLHKEVEHLRAQISQLTQSTGKAEHVHPVDASGLPSSGQVRDVPPIETQDMKHVKYRHKKSEEKGPSEGEKEAKKNKKSGKKDDGMQRRERLTEDEHAEEWKDRKRDKSRPEEEKTGKSKEWRDKKEQKRDKRREDGKVGKENQEKEVFKEWIEINNQKKDRHEGQKDWKDTGKKKVKDDKDKEWKPRGERKVWKEETEWANDKQSSGNDQKEQKGAKKEWKEKGESRRGKNEGQFSDETQKKWKEEKEFTNKFSRKELEKNHWRAKDKKRTAGGGWKEEDFKEERKSKTHYHKHDRRKSNNEKEKQPKDENDWSIDVKHGHSLSDQTSAHNDLHNDQRQHNGPDHDNYWPRQREKIQHNYRRRRTCRDVADCARVEGLSPVSLQDFEILLQSYLNKIQDREDQTSNKEELSKLVKEFFTNGVFPHDHMSFSEFVEDVADILEDMAGGEDSDTEESEEDDDDEEMGEFEREAMEMFALSEEVGKVEMKGNKKKAEK